MTHTQGFLPPLLGVSEDHSDWLPSRLNFGLLAGGAGLEATGQCAILPAASILSAF